MTRQAVIVVCLGAVLGLAGCGKLGTLERPGPATGADAGVDPLKASRTVDPRNRNADPSPSVSSAETTPGSAAATPQ